MAEPLFAAALAAGVVEGGSIFWSNAKKETNASQIAGLALSSILYGTAALPMTLIGASPGPAMLLSLPYYSPPSRKEDVGPAAENETPFINATESLVQPKSPTALPLQKPSRSRGKPVEESRQPSREESQEDKRSELIRRTREENRRMIAAVKQKRQAQYPNKGSSTETPRTHSSKPSMLNRYFATLDGKALATPLAEGMRRTRILLVGAGLVTLLVSNQRSTENQGAVVSGRNLAAEIHNFVEKQPQGVAIRLTRNRLVDAKSKSVVPFVIENIQANDAHSKPLHWKLGPSQLEWKQMPLTSQWLMHPEKSTKVSTKEESDGTVLMTPLLVVEADVSIPIGAIGERRSPTRSHLRRRPASSHRWHDHGPARHHLHQGLSRPPTADSPDGILSLDSARFMSRVIDTVARQNGTLTTADASLVSILVGSDRVIPFQQQDEIYINGRSAVAARVASFVQDAYEDVSEEVPAVAGDEENESPNELDLESEGGSAIVRFIDHVGEAIRQGGVSVVKAANFLVTSLGSLSGKNDKVIIVVSDNDNIATWLRGTMPEWSISWRDTSPQNMDSIAEHGGIVVVCCKSDEATSNFVCSMLSSDFAKETKVLALFQQQQSAVTLDWLVDDFAQKHKPEALSISTESVDDVHNALFARAQELLASGKTPMEVQEFMNDSG